MQSFPDDADGDALRRLIACGYDLARPMQVDFQVAVPSEEAGQAVAEAAGKLGYRAKVVHEEEEDEWTCWCSCEMTPSYGTIIAAQAELELIAVPHGGYADGWGTFGNA